MNIKQRREDALANILLRLNPNQLNAVTSETNIPLQIVAGPGTGKTAVLTARVLYLLLRCNYEPHHIIVTTFTKRAANEMTERLAHLLPSELGIDLSRLFIGTFHSICARILRQNGHHIDLPQDFKIADERDSKQILDRILSNPSKELLDLTSYMEELRKTNQLGEFDLVITQGDINKYHGYDLDKIRRLLSSLKSNAMTSEDYKLSPTKSLELSQIYSEYETSLSNSSYLDFDDILLQTRELLQSKNCLSYIKHVLIDEFQDTNKIQLELMYLFSSQSSDQYLDNVTIVGDPDQSIYAFRNAVAENFDRMRHHYQRPIQVIFLDQNYRSTKAVLEASEALMKQEQKTNRVAKNLRTMFSQNFKIISNRFDSNRDEAEFIAREIKMLLELPGLFKKDDFAILLRSRFHSRVIEQSLRRCNITYKVLQGKAFWQLKEIQVIIDYLRCISSETDRLLFIRVLNVPPRGIGPKSMQKLIDLIDGESGRQNSTYGFLEHIRSGTLEASIIKMLGNNTVKGVKNFITTVEKAKLLLLDEKDFKDGISKMFDYLVQETNLLERNRSEDPLTTENNLKEFKREILEFEFIDRALPDPETGDYLDEVECHSRITFLSNYLESIDLYETEKDEDSNSPERSKVVISTIHGAKGLEWPVVFVPNLTESYFPAAWALKSDAHNTGSAKNLERKMLEGTFKLVNEERRALYVAMTRAKNLLYLNGFRKRIFGEEELEESRFLKNMGHHFKERNEALLNITNLQGLYELRNVKFPKKDNTVLKQLLATYSEYHDTEKIGEPSNHVVKSLPTPKGGSFITSARSALKRSNKLTPVSGGVSQKRKAPTFKPTQVQDMHTKKPNTVKKSFAPSYVYNKKSFK